MSDVLNLIIRLVQNKIGVSESAVSQSSWTKIITSRLTLTGSSSLEDYLLLLERSDDEFKNLIELVVVPETWFFRDRSSIDFLVHYIKNQWTYEQSHQKVIRVLSLPSSSGEEPYSIGMALLHAHIPLRMFKIDAIDISGLAVEKAKLGVYGSNSFRSKDLDYRNEFFDQVPHAYCIREPLKSRVHFFCQNVFEPGFLRGKPQYDVIFCRNLLIYLQASYQKQLLDLLNQLLSSKGILFVAPVEAELLRGLGYFPDPHLRTFAFHKRTGTPKIEEKQAVNLLPSFKPKSPLLTVNGAKSKVAPLSLEDAGRLANLGQFEEAEAICQVLLKEKGPDPEGFFLLGVIQHAIRQESKAEEFFLKTIYLNPYHYAALVYLSLLAERKGDAHQADLYRQRAVKAANEQGGVKDKKNHE